MDNSMVSGMGGCLPLGYWTNREQFHPNCSVFLDHVGPMSAGLCDLYLGIATFSSLLEN